MRVRRFEQTLPGGETFRANLRTLLYLLVRDVRDLGANFRFPDRAPQLRDDQTAILDKYVEEVQRMLINNVFCDPRGGERHQAYSAGYRDGLQWSKAVGYPTKDADRLANIVIERIQQRDREDIGVAEDARDAFEFGFRDACKDWTVKLNAREMCDQKEGMDERC